MVSKRSDERPTGNRPPVTLYLAYLEGLGPGLRGSDRTQQWVMVYWVTEADWRSLSARKDVRGQLELPSDRSGYREERDGSVISHHLNTSVESIIMNVGGLLAEVSSPPLNQASVGGVIVLGARESRVQGEGRQLVEISAQNNRMSTQGNPS